MNVPWQVSPSTPFLEVHVREGEAENAQVTFVGHFALLQSAPKSRGSIEVGFSQAAIVERPNLALHVEAGKEGPYQLVRVIFEQAGCVRTGPVFQEGEPLRPDDYDWSAFPAHYRPNEDLADIRKWLEGYLADWRAAGVCPIPGFYEVEKSPWSEEKAFGGQHYIVTGLDTVVEVLAHGWRYESLGALKNW